MISLVFGVGMTSPWLASIGSWLDWGEDVIQLARGAHPHPWRMA
jgi:hypothetical protein